MESQRDLWMVGFPNSVMDFDADELMTDIADAGISRFIICSGIYAGYRLVMPRNPKRQVYSLEEGKFYFRPDQRFYEGCRAKPTGRPRTLERLPACSMSPSRVRLRVPYSREPTLYIPEALLPAARRIASRRSSRCRNWKGLSPLPIT